MPNPTSQQRVVITEIQNPKFFSNTTHLPHVTVQKHGSAATTNNRNYHHHHHHHDENDNEIEFKSRYLRVGQKSVKPQFGGTIRDYLVEKQYEQSSPSQQQDENLDPFANRSKARPKPKFSFHPEFNAHFAVRDRVKVKKRSEEEHLDEVQWFGPNQQQNPAMNRENNEIFFPHAPQERQKAVVSTNAIVKTQSSSGAPVSQRVNIVYEDPQMAALEHHEKRQREEEEKRQRVAHFQEKVRERVVKRQKREQQKRVEKLRKQSPTKKEKMKSYAARIQKRNTKKYNKEQQKKYEDEARAREYQQLIEKQQELSRRQQMAQREQEIYAKRQPDPHAHQLSGRTGRSSAIASARSHVSKRSILHSARGSSTARSRATLSARSHGKGAALHSARSIRSNDTRGGSSIATSARSSPGVMAPEPRSARQLRTPEKDTRRDTSTPRQNEDNVPRLPLDRVSGAAEYHQTQQVEPTKPQFTPSPNRGTIQQHSPFSSPHTIQRLQEQEQQQQQQDQATLEEGRYIEALRLQLIAKVKQQDIQLPPLCNCGLDPFDDHPKKCCNNCEFYGNPGAYVRLLESLLYSYGISV